MKNKLVTVVIMLAVTAGSFYGGMRYAQSKGAGGQFSRADFQNLSSKERQQRFQQFGASAGANFGGAKGGAGGGNGAGFAAGEIITKDDKSITLRLPNNSSRVVLYATSTKVQKSVGGALDDLAAGQQITINGEANADGSLTAQAIQIR